MYWVSIGQQWLVLDGTESIYDGTGQFLTLLGQYRDSMLLYNERSGVWSVITDP